MSRLSLALSAAAYAPTNARVATRCSRRHALPLAFRHPSHPPMPQCASRLNSCSAAGPIADVFDEAMDIQSDMVHRAHEEKQDAEAKGDGGLFDGGSQRRRASVASSLERQKTSSLFPVALKQSAPRGDTVMRALRRGLMTSNAETRARAGKGTWAVLSGSLKKVRMRAAPAHACCQPVLCRHIGV